ncbi:ABC transporter ATP-binding protein [Pseudonocardia sp. NPDC046786]|uniref:ABC transporter ATP-binding protein n=1 Tax=Pseudonocardia sp. NPDC046786 TaxID=3155471 RepID=UPI0033C4D1C3
MSAPPTLWQLVAPVRLRLAAATALGAVGAGISVLGTVLLAHTVAGLAADAGGRAEVLLRCGIAAVALVVGFALSRAAFRVSHAASNRLERHLRRGLAETIARAPLGAAYRLGAGGLKKVAQDDVRSLHALVADSVPMVGASFATPVVAVAAMAAVQWRLVPVILLTVPVALWCVRQMGRDYPEQQARYERAAGAVDGAVVEFVQGMPVVRTFDDGRTSFRRFSDAVREFSAAVAAWTATGRRADLATRLLVAPLPTLAVIAVAGVAMLLAGWVTVPELVVALVIGALPVESVLPVLYMVDFLKRSKAGVGGISDVLAIEPLPEPDRPQIPRGGEVVFQNVTFGYEPDRPALRGVDITVPAGTTCALVGPSGSGKSTVARLVARFFDVDAGAVRVGGVDVRDMTSQTLLQHVALVFQEPFLVEGTVAENIRLGRPDATDEEVRAAAKAAAAHDFVVGSLPAGYDSPVGERGALLSGGQRQRITIARAILSDAPVVVLDEATAFADPETEAQVQEAVAGVTAGRTVLVVAHRLGSIIDADRIVVMEGGRVVEAGTGTELRAHGGRFARMWQAHEEAARWRLGAAGEETS